MDFHDKALQMEDHQSSLQRMHRYKLRDRSVDCTHSEVECVFADPRERSILQRKILDLTLRLSCHSTSSQGGGGSQERTEAGVLEPEQKLLRLWLSWRTSQIEGVSVIPDRYSLSSGPASGTGNTYILVVECAALVWFDEDAPVSMIGATHKSASEVGFAATARDKNHAMSHAWKSPSNHKPHAAGVNMRDLFQFVTVMQVWKMQLTPVLTWLS
jgi:hypothetical protein